jgi:hypothetical protein
MGTLINNRKHIKEEHKRYRKNMYNFISKKEQTRRKVCGKGEEEETREKISLFLDFYVTAQHRTISRCQDINN